MISHYVCRTSNDFISRRGIICWDLSPVIKWFFPGEDWVRCLHTLTHTLSLCSLSPPSIFTLVSGVWMFSVGSAHTPLLHLHPILGSRQGKKDRKLPCYVLQMFWFFIFYPKFHFETMNNTRCCPQHWKQSLARQTTLPLVSPNQSDSCEWGKTTTTQNKQRKRRGWSLKCNRLLQTRELKYNLRIRRHSGSKQFISFNSPTGKSKRTIERVVYAIFLSPCFLDAFPWATLSANPRVC